MISTRSFRQHVRFVEYVIKSKTFGYVILSLRPIAIPAARKTLFACIIFSSLLAQSEFVQNKPGFLITNTYRS
jgi:hypothetical protein